jgi:hypothetical protein
MQMSMFMFRSKELKSLCLSESTAALRMVFHNEIHKGLADDHAHLDWLAGVIPNLTATALENGYIRRPIEHQITSHGVRDDLLQVSQGDILINGDE